MSPTKLAILAIYAVMIVLALASADSALGIWSLRILLILALVHSIEVFVFYRRCREAGGSMVNHVLNVFLFGVAHVGELKKQA